MLAERLDVVEGHAKRLGRTQVQIALRVGDRDAGIAELAVDRFVDLRGDRHPILDIVDVGAQRQGQCTESKPGSCRRLGGCLCSRFAAWFPGGAT